MAYTDNIQLLQEAETLYQQGDVEEARRLIKLALENDPEDAQTWWAYANITEFGSYQHHALKKVLSLDPQHTDALMMLRPYEGKVFERKKKGHDTIWRSIRENRLIPPGSFYRMALLSLAFYILFYPVGVALNLLALLHIHQYKKRPPYLEPPGSGCHLFLATFLFYIPTFLLIMLIGALCTMFTLFILIFSLLPPI